MLHTDVGTTSSHLSAFSDAHGIERELRATHLGPVFPDTPRLWVEETQDTIRIYEDVQFVMNSIAKITQSIYRQGPLVSETRLRIRDYPPGSTDPLVTDYWLEEYRSGLVQATVAHSVPQVRGHAIRIEDQRMVEFDYRQLHIDLKRIEAMQHSNIPAQNLSKVEYLG
jgi:hypothetical protein